MMQSSQRYLSIPELYWELVVWVDICIINSRLIKGSVYAEGNNARSIVIVTIQLLFYIPIGNNLLNISFLVYGKPLIFSII